MSTVMMGLRVAALTSLVLLALELPRIPWAAYSSRPLLLAQAAPLLVAEGLRYLWPGALSIIGLLVARGLGTPQSATRRRLLEGVLLGLPVLGCYGALALYEPFRLYPPFIIALILVWLFLFAVSEWTLRPTPRLKGMKRLIYLGAPPTIAMGSAVLAGVINHTQQKGLYPTLHLCVLMVTHLLLLAGVWAIFHLVSLREQPLHVGHLRPAVAWSGNVAIVFVVAAPLLNQVGLLQSSEPYVRAYTTSGQSQVIFHEFKSPKAEGRPQVAADSDALGRFARDSNFPVIPRSFELTDYNVLLITSEATRFDHTSLSETRIAQMPNVARFRDNGSFIFTRAYSASSGTLHSMSSLLGMTYPSALRLETYKKPWHGNLSNERPIVPQIFKGGGYDTFWVGHCHGNCFRSSITGFTHGFDAIDFFRSKPAKTQGADSPKEKEESPYPELDKDIATSAIARLKSAAKADKRFFGWVFFGGPHSDYEAHYPEMPADSAHDLYLQELRYMDEHLGRVLDTLEETKLLENTVVIYMGDHGEEFQEHGGRYHKSTVYSEVTHVPLAIRIPGIKGKDLHQPVSTYYTFPWLFLKGTDKMREAAEERLKLEIGPMMRETQGAVVIELIGHDRMMSSLVYDDIKFNYDFLSLLYEAYEVKTDPLEQKNLFDGNVTLAEQALQRMGAYRKVREARAQYILSPENTR